MSPEIKAPLSYFRQQCKEMTRKSGCWISGNTKHVADGMKMLNIWVILNNLRGFSFSFPIAQQQQGWNHNMKALIFLVAVSSPPSLRIYPRNSHQGDMTDHFVIFWSICCQCSPAAFVLLLWSITRIFLFMSDLFVDCNHQSNNSYKCMKPQ